LLAGTPAETVETLRVFGRIPVWPAISLPENQEMGKLIGKGLP
jgi:hypothetical protein